MEEENSLDWMAKGYQTKGGRGPWVAISQGKKSCTPCETNWRFHSEGEALWAQVLRRKYCSGKRVRAANPSKLPCSSIWAAMKRGMDTFTKGSRWMVGRDSKLSLWHSNWLSKGPLRSLIQGPLPREVNQLEVKDFFTRDGLGWNRLSFKLPSDVKMMIQATPIAMTSRGRDKLAWANSPEGTPNLKSVYRIAMGA